MAATGLVVASAVGLVAALTTGTWERLLGVATPTADVAATAPADPTDAAAAGPGSSPTVPPDIAGAGADAPAPATDGPGAFETAAVSLEDDDGGTAMFTIANAAPGSADTGCITVTYHGGSDAAVRLYGTTTGTGLDAYLHLAVTRGTFPSGPPAFDSCTGFVPDPPDYIGAGAGTVYDGALDDLPDNYDAGLDDPPGAPETWTDSETHAYRFALTVDDDNAAQGLTASQTFTWEARGEDPPAPPVPVPVVQPSSGPPGTVVTVASGSDPCVPPVGTVGPRVWVWISAPETGENLADVTLPVGADGSWSGTITVPEAAAAFAAVDFRASCFDAADATGATGETAATAAPYRTYTAVPFTVMAPEAAPGSPAPGAPGSGTPAPGTPAPPATPVSAQPTFTG